MINQLCGRFFVYRIAQINLNMNKLERIEHLKTHHSPTWSSTRRKVFDEFSDKQTMFCCCGKLATGLHEQKFNSKVNNETAERLKDLESTIEKYDRMSFMSSEATGRYPTSKDLE